MSVETVNQTDLTGLYKKILIVQSTASAISKDKQHPRFKYASEEAVLDEVKTIANNVGLIVVIDGVETTLGESDIENKLGKPDKRRWARVDVSYSVIDAETGQAIKTVFTGYGESVGDKAVYIAMTGANKYFWMKFFGVATSDDPEAFHSEPAEKPAQPQGKDPFSF